MYNRKKILMFYILALIIFIEPQSFKDLNFSYLYVDYIYKILKLVVSIIMILCLVVSRNNKIIDKFIVITFIYQGFMFLSTLLNHGSLTRFVGPSLTVISTAILSKCIIRDGMLLPTIKYLNKYFLICFIINTLSIISIDISGSGIYFLGIDNRFVWTFFPWMVCVGIEDLLTKGKFTKKYYITFALIEFTLFYKWSVGAMVSMLLFFFPPFLRKRKIPYRKINMINLAINYIITTINLARIKFIKFIVIDLLKKDLTYSGRTFLWKGIYNVIKSKPLLGGGTQTIDAERTFFFLTSGSHQLEFLRVMHAHNSFMTILYRGGILSLLSYIYIVFISMKSLAKNSNHLLAPLFLIAFIVILLLSLFDTIDFAFLFFFFGLCYNIGLMKDDIMVQKEKAGIL